jgi:hypothetical protein
MEYTDVKVEEIPCQFEIELAGEIFSLEFNYNYKFDFFTVNLSKNGEVIVNGEKIMYGQPLFSSVFDSRLPKVNIVPRDSSGKEDRLGWDELGTSVFLMVEAIE